MPDEAMGGTKGLRYGRLVGGPTIDPIFSLCCVDCENAGEPSRLWLRRSIERPDAGRSDSERHSSERLSFERHDSERHYVECMNCGAHLKGRPDGRMETVGDDEWRSFVDEESTHAGSVRPS